MADPIQYIHGSAKVRKTVFVGLFVWMLANPICGQILGFDTPWLRPWIMFDGVGVGLYDLRVFNSQGNGLEPIAWQAPDEPGAADSRLGLRTAEQVEQVVLRLCADSENPAGLRALIRLNTAHRWETRVTADNAICAEPLNVE